MNTCLPCGKSVVIKNKPKSCDDGCLYAPIIRWLCKDGPNPGSLFEFNILEECDDFKLPDGEFIFQLYDYDGDFYDNVVITESGDVRAYLSKKYDKGKEGRIRYKIVEVGGEGRRKTGEIYVCSKDLCRDKLGVCDPLTGFNVYGKDFWVEANCGDVLEFDVSDWIGNISVYDSSDCLTAELSSGFLRISLNDCDAGQSVYVKTQVVDDSGTVEAFYDTSIVIKDMCENVICPEGFECDNCSGNCEEKPEIQLLRNNEIKIY